MRIFCSAIGVSLFMSGAVLADTNSDCGQDANAVLASRAAPRSSNKPGVATQSLILTQYTNAYAGRGFVYLLGHHRFQSSAQGKRLFSAGG